MGASLTLRALTAKSDAGDMSPTSPVRCTRSVRSLGSTEVGDHDIRFNNRRCVVVPPGVAEAVMKHVEAVAEYHRDGNLHLCDFPMSDFVRQGQGSEATGNRTPAVNDLQDRAQHQRSNRLVVVAGAPRPRRLWFGRLPPPGDLLAEG